MSKPKFVYVSYISTTPEKLWNALIDGEMTKQYWARHRNASDWEAGSKWEHQDYDDAGKVDVVGKVMESTPAAAPGADVGVSRRCQRAGETFARDV